MELKDTIELMNSKNYKDRMRAEYWQTKIRYNKLYDMIITYKSGMLNFKPNCTLDILNVQATHMEGYLKTLEIRAEIEGFIL